MDHIYMYIYIYETDEKNICVQGIKICTTIANTIDRKVQQM